MSSCKVCDEKTENIFNINFKKVPICESCAVSITTQQVYWWADQPPSKEENKNEGNN